MRVLAIDTALEACSAAVLDTNSGIAASETLAMTRGHAEAVTPLIARVMSAAAIEFVDLDRIAVTTGPGSFTGLRVGISAARGIALAAGKPAVGLSTLAGFAAPLIADDDSMQVVAAIDARHEQVYLQVFGSGGRTVVAPRVASVRWIHALSAGVENQLFPELRASDVVLTNGRGIFAPALAEFVLAAMLHFAKHVQRLLQQRSERRWDFCCARASPGQMPRAATNYWDKTRC